jgi:hypothetical protein
MAPAHVIEMGFFFKKLEQIQVQDFWKTKFFGKPI